MGKKLQIMDVGAPVVVTVKSTGEERSYKPVTFAPADDYDQWGREVLGQGRKRVRNVWEDDLLFNTAKAGKLVDGHYETVKTTPHLVNGTIRTKHTFVVFAGEDVESLAASQDFKLVTLPGGAPMAVSMPAETPAPVLLEDED